MSNSTDNIPPKVTPGRIVLVNTPRFCPWRVGVVVEVNNPETINVYVFPTSDSPGGVVLKARHHECGWESWSEPGWKFPPRDS